MPATRFLAVLTGVKFALIVPIQPVRRLFAKKTLACAVAFVSRVVFVLSIMNFRPASTPASHACCIRLFTTYNRAMSIAEPAIAQSGIIAAAMIASVFPFVSRRRRPNIPPAVATLLRIFGSRIDHVMIHRVAMDDDPVSPDQERWLRRR